MTARYLDAVDCYTSDGLTQHTSHVTRHTSHTEQLSHAAGERTKQARVDALVHTMQRYKPSASEAAADFLRRDSSRNVPEKRQDQAGGDGLALVELGVELGVESGFRVGAARTHGIPHFFRNGLHLFVGELFHAPALQGAEARLQGLQLLPQERNVVDMGRLFEGHAKSVTSSK